MSDWAKEYLQQVEDCENRESRLNDWQRGFIDSLKTQIIAGRHPTPRQVEKLDEAWEQATKRG